MAMLAWAMMGLALWHFTVLVPDRFLWGIVGALIGAVTGACLVAWALSGFQMPSREATDLATTFLAVPGSLLGIALMWFLGDRKMKAEAAPSSPAGAPAR